MKNSAELKSYLQRIEDQSADISPIHQLAALNDILKSANIEKTLDAGNKALAVKIWDRIKAQGVQIERPPILS